MEFGDSQNRRLPKIGTILETAAKHLSARLRKPMWHENREPETDGNNVDRQPVLPNRRCSKLNCVDNLDNDWKSKFRIPRVPSVSFDAVTVH